MRPSVSVIVLSLTLSLGGCASTGERNWGEDATLFPGWGSIKQAAGRAAADPKTWMPLVGAATVYAAGQDERIATWAGAQRPVFGNDASDVSDKIRGVADAAYTLTALATPSGDNPAEWVANKAKGFLVGNASFAVTREVTDVFKERAGRTRPNGESTRSFFSGHTSFASARVALAMRNVDAIEMAEPVRASAQVGLYSISAGMAWARVEAGVHYPSDVLAAMAAGNFIANFFNDAFLAPVTDTTRLAVVHSLDGTLLLVSVRY